MSPLAPPSIRVLHISLCHTLSTSLDSNIFRALRPFRLLGEADLPPHSCLPKLEQVKCAGLPQVKSICSNTVFPSLQPPGFYLSPLSGANKTTERPGEENNAPEKCFIVGGREWHNNLQWQDGDFKTALEPHIFMIDDVSPSTNTIR